MQVLPTKVPTLTGANGHPKTVAANSGENSEDYLPIPCSIAKRLGRNWDNYKNGERGFPRTTRAREGGGAPPTYVAMRMRRTCTAAQEPPRAAVMPLSFRALAICCGVVQPVD